MQALSKYLFSTSNIVGALAALCVTILYLLGFFSQGWLWFSLGAYAAGALPFLFQKEVPIHLADGLSTTEALQQLKENMLPKLPPNARKILAEIIERVEALMPRLKQMEAEGMIEAPSRAMLKQTVVRLLPDAIENYLRLPNTYARMKKLPNGKTAQVVLEEQLQMLNLHVQELEENLLSSDVNSMLANGQFLQEKLRPGSLFD